MFRFSAASPGPKWEETGQKNIWGGGGVVWRERERGMGKEGDRKDEEVRKKMTE